MRSLPVRPRQGKGRAGTSLGFPAVHPLCQRTAGAESGAGKGRLAASADRWEAFARQFLPRGRSST